MNTGNEVEKKVLLIVDDRPENLDLLISFLEKCDYSIIVAKSGEETFQRFEYSKPDIILLDIMMPGIDGFETCRRLKEDDRYKDIPVIFMSALDDTVDKVKGLELGAVDYISKPFMHEEVLARINNHLQIQDLRSKLSASNRTLEKANERLKELDQLKSLFIASMSHELRTPLNSIIGFTCMTLEGLSGVLNEEQEDNIFRVHRSAKHLLALISDIIDISKVEAGAMDVYCEPFFLHEITSEAINNIQHILNGKSISFEANISEGIKLNTDRKRFLQCLVNLLSNAVKYTEAGKIIVSSKIVGGNLELSVEDTGIGISKKDQIKLFKAFERINTRLTIKEGGTGLGLYLTKKIMVELLKGVVEVESREGVGSTFRLRLPMILNLKSNE
jgi:two-component system, sensor histidine kinase and response regulator